MKTPSYTPSQLIHLCYLHLALGAKPNGAAPASPIYIPWRDDEIFEEWLNLVILSTSTPK